MTSFKNIYTGILEIPSNQLVIEQYRKRPDLYEEIQESKAHTSTNLKNMSNLTLKELKRQADILGLSYNKNASKAQILSLLEKVI